MNCLCRSSHFRAEYPRNLAYMQHFCKFATEFELKRQPGGLHRVTAAVALSYSSEFLTNSPLRKMYQ